MQDSLKEMFLLTIRDTVSVIVGSQCDDSVFYGQPEYLSAPQDRELPLTH